MYFRLFGDYHEVHKYVAYSHQVLGNYEFAREHYKKAKADANLDALILGGILYDRLGAAERTDQAWRKGSS